MKKNVMMRVASALLVAVLLSTCAISGTFAKYVTADEGSDSARVAKWGVTIEADSFDMFAKQYDSETADFTGLSVESTEDVFAPGTSGEFAAIAITGTPEVAVEVAVDPTVTVSGNWTVAGAFYCPIVVTVGDTAICGLACDDATDFADEIAAAIRGYSAQYAPNKDLTEITNGTNFDISWEWAFEDDDHAALGCECAAGAQTDIKDTALGDIAADPTAEALKIEIGVKITVTQID